MRLEDVSLRQIVEDCLWWSDFEDGPNDPKLKEEAARNDEMYAKFMFLNQQETGELFDLSTLSIADFYTVELNELARFALADGESDEDAFRDSEVEFDRDYSGIRILIEDMIDMWAVYMKDYSLGYIQPLGMCVYPCEYDEDTDVHDPESLREHIERYILPALALEIWEGNIDLRQEIYNYYHHLPDIESPLLKDRVNLEGLLTVNEAAAKLGVSGPRVKKMIAERTLDGFKHGGNVLITESSVLKRLRYIEEHGKPMRGKEKTSWLDGYKKKSE